MSSVFKSYNSEMAGGALDGPLAADSQETVHKNGGPVPSVSSHVDKVSSFSLSGSKLLQEKVVTAALGTNHSAFVKGASFCVWVEFFLLVRGNGRLAKLCFVWSC